MSLLIQKYIIYPSLARMMIYSSFKVRCKCFFPSDGLFSSSTALSFYLSLSLLKIILIPWVAIMQTLIIRVCGGKQMDAGYFPFISPDLISILFHPDLCQDCVWTTSTRSLVLGIQEVSANGRPCWKIWGRMEHEIGVISPTRLYIGCICIPLPETTVPV